MCYFKIEKIFNHIFEKNVKKYAAISSRRKRQNIYGFEEDSPKGKFFVAGDIIRVYFSKGSTNFFFEGICLSIHFRTLLNKQASFLIRNIIIGVGIEMTLSYYFNRLYKSIFLDYKRKKFYYNKARLYYLRNRINRETRVKY